MWLRSYPERTSALIMIGPYAKRTRDDKLSLASAADPDCVANSCPKHAGSLKVH